jgi:hypothetical protein
MKRLTSSIKVSFRLLMFIAILKTLPVQKKAVITTVFLHRKRRKWILHLLYMVLKIHSTLLQRFNSKVKQIRMHTHD